MYATPLRDHLFELCSSGTCCTRKHYFQPRLSEHTCLTLRLSLSPVRSLGPLSEGGTSDASWNKKKWWDSIDRCCLWLCAQPSAALTTEPLVVLGATTASSIFGSVFWRRCCCKLLLATSHRTENIFVPRREPLVLVVFSISLMCCFECSGGWGEAGTSLYIPRCIFAVFFFYGKVLRNRVVECCSSLLKTFAQKSCGMASTVVHVLISTAPRTTLPQCVCA